MDRTSDFRSWTIQRQNIKANIKTLLNVIKKEEEELKIVKIRLIDQMLKDYDELAIFLNGDECLTIKKECFDDVRNKIKDIQKSRNIIDDMEKLDTELKNKLHSLQYPDYIKCILCKDTDKNECGICIGREPIKTGQLYYSHICQRVDRCEACLGSKKIYMYLPNDSNLSLYYINNKIKKHDDGWSRVDLVVLGIMTGEEVKIKFKEYINDYVKENDILPNYITIRDTDAIIYHDDDKDYLKRMIHISSNSLKLNNRSDLYDYTNCINRLMSDNNHWGKK